MKKILATLLAFTSLIACASTVNFPIQCSNSVSITATSTLSDVQKCVVSKQKATKGMYEVDFKDNNGHSYTCMFAAESATAPINNCK